MTGEDPYDRLVVVLRTADDVLYLMVAGELDFDTAPRVREVLSRAPLAEAECLVIDLSALTFCDSSGISIFLVAHRAAAAVGVPTMLAGTPERVRGMLRLTGLEDLFSSHADPGAADQQGDGSGSAT